jgi:hypothetical protein
MRTFRILVASAALLALVHAAAAQISDKQAVAQVKTATKAQLKTFKQAGSAALATLGSKLGDFEKTLTDSTTPATVATNMDTIVKPFLESMHEAYIAAVFNVDSSASQALESLAGGGNLQGLYPKDLYYGTGGVLDDYRASLRAAVAKVHDAAQKRLAKTSKLAEKVSNLALEVTLRLPVLDGDESVDQNNVTPLGTSARIDYIASVSSLDAANDAVFHMAGLTSNIAVNVDLGLFSGDGILDTGLIPTDGEGHFEASFNGVHEGGYVAFVKQGGQFASTVPVGVR